TYALNAPVNQSFDRNYNSGVFQYRPFIWTNGLRDNPGWLKVSEVLKYSPQGDAVEEIDALKLYSAAKFGYNGSLPYLVAKNADYNSVLFESFEKKQTADPAKFEDGFSVPSYTMQVNGDSHSGRSSLSIGASQTFKVRDFNATTQLTS